MSAGKVRQGPLYDKMKYLRKVFINTIKFAKKNKQKIEDNILLKKFREKNSKEVKNFEKKLVIEKELMFSKQTVLRV